MCVLDRRSLAALALAVLAAACAGDPVAPEPPCTALAIDELPESPNVIVIVSDTMRRDRIGIYGGAASTPSFDAFARDHVLFDRAYTNAPWTKPAIGSMFTSLYPSQHGLASHPELRRRVGRSGRGDALVDVLNGEYSTLAELFRAEGYRTAAFVSNPWMGEEFGFAQGFEIYDDSFARWSVAGDRVSRAGLRWLSGLDPGEPFFLYLHYIDAHRPYGLLTDELVEENLARWAEGPRTNIQEARTLYHGLVHHPQQGLSAESVERLVAIGPTVALIDFVYDRGVEAFDRALGMLLAGLVRHPAWPRTAVLIVSDHGEALFEHQYGSHGLGLHDDEVAIPLAARLPGASAEQGRVDCAVELVDVLPTLCDYAGLVPPEHVFGQSLLERGGESQKAREHYAVSEGVMFKPRHRTIRNRNYKLMWEPDGSPAEPNREYALYDLREDPLERRNLAAPQFTTAETRRILETLTARLREAVPEFEPPRPEYAPVDPAVKERLRALGYVD
jgi:choline-sulfatase